MTGYLNYLENSIQHQYSSSSCLGHTPCGTPTMVIQINENQAKVSIHNANGRYKAVKFHNNSHRRSMFMWMGLVQEEYLIFGRKLLAYAIAARTKPEQFKKTLKVSLLGNMLFCERNFSTNLASSDPINNISTGMMLALFLDHL